MRDLTRGGLATALNEIAKDAGVGMTILEDRIPVKDSVQGACEILGLDPLYVANEGRCVLFVPSAHADAALCILHRHAVSRDAVEIGNVIESDPSLVVLQTSFHTERVLDWLSGEQLPRIC
jgi:hydrogenase expression/formation protein HypE